jgi:O-antigen ligase/Flp pilus assembly protein TadD
LTLLDKALTVFVVVVLVADLLSPNPQRALFSDYQKMEGFIGLLHFYLFFLVLTRIFRSERDWTLFFSLTIAVSCVVAIIALLQVYGVALPLLPKSGPRIYSTIGNASYLAAYLLFHVQIALVLIGRSWPRRGLVAALGIVLCLQLAAMYFTATRSVMLALLLTGLFVVVLVVLFFSRLFPRAAQRKKRWAVMALVLFVAAPLCIGLAKDSDFIQSSTALKRLTKFTFSDYTGDGTINTRIMLWQTAWQGIVERPLLGWGQENFFLVFQKYFDPGMYGKEQWFDRAHNLILDWLIHAGLLGLGAYVALWFATACTLWHGICRRVLPPWQGLVLVALLLSYVLNNQFQFDTFNSYFLFFAALAYVQFVARIERESELEAPKRRVGGKQAAALFAVVLCGVGTVVYWVNIRPLAEARALERALQISEFARQSDELGMEDVLAAFEEALEYETFGRVETREGMAREAQQIVAVSRFSDEEKRRFVQIAVDQLRGETGHAAADVRHLLMLAVTLNSARALNGEYVVEAEKTLRAAVQLSPSKQSVHFALARMHLDAGEVDAALDVLERAWALELNYTGAAANLLVVAIATQRADRVEEVEHSVSLTQWEPQDLKAIGRAYRQAQNFEAALRVYERLSELEPRQAEYHFVCGVLLVHFRRYDEARIYFTEAVRLDGKREQAARRFLGLIEVRSTAP